jgi:acetylornithine/succinyldiaminopimelate/putrescine aminotransferase
MYPIHDFDVLLLMATALSSKRRPADLVEIVAAADLIQGSIPSEAKLVEAFHRLGGHGLIVAAESGYALTPAGEELVAGQPRKGSTAERFSAVRDNLAEYQPLREHPPVVVTEEQVAEAVQAHRAAAKSAVPNLLAPKPKVSEKSTKRYDQRRRFGTPPRRKD